MGIKQALINSYKDAAQLIDTIVNDSETILKTVSVAEMITQVFNQNGRVLICGNGGSACDAMHFAEEFTGRYRDNRRPLPVIALADASHITCVGNDYGFDEIFARGVQAYGQKNDLLIGLSTSGNSKNIIRAFEEAKSLGMKRVALLGKTGGELKGNADVEWVIEATTSDRIQEVHMTILHIIIEGVERILFPKNYTD